MRKFLYKGKKVPFQKLKRLQFLIFKREREYLSYYSKNHKLNNRPKKFYSLKFLIDCNFKHHLL